MSMEIERRQAAPQPGPTGSAELVRLTRPEADHPNVSTLSRALAAIVRYKWLVLAVAVAGTSAGVAGSRLVSPQYTAQALIWVESGGSNVIAEGPIQPRELLTSVSWVQLLRSYEVLDHVVLTTSLYLRPGAGVSPEVFRGFAVDSLIRPGEYRLEVDETQSRFSLYEVPGRLIDTGTLGDSVGRSVGMLWQPERNLLRRHRSIHFTIHAPRDVARSIGERLDARMDRAESFLSIQLTDTDPQRAAAIVNAVVERYIDVAGRLKRERLEVLTEILAEQVSFAERNLQEAEAALEGFRVSTITLPAERATPVTPGLEETRDPVFANFFRLQMDIEDLRRDREAIQSALADAEAGAPSVERLEMVPAVGSVAELSQALRLSTEKRAELRALRLRYTDDYPAVRDILRELEELERATIPSLAARLVEQLWVREAELSSMAASAAGEIQQIPPRMIEEARRRRQVDIAANLYTELQGRYEETRLAAVSALPDVSVLDWATVPRQPSRDDRNRLLMMAAMGSLGIAIALAILRDRMDRRIRYPEQVTHDLGLAILGAVPRLPRGGRGAIDRDTAEQVLESLRVIRMNMMHAHGSAGPLVTTITSTGADDGKSFIAAQLGVTFAELGNRTLLVDGDVRRGALHTLVEASRKPGLTDVLRGEVPVAEAVQRTEYENLDVLACGTRYGNGPDLLVLPAMRQLLADLRAAYSVILIDSPPIGAAVDGYILATLGGTLTFVLRNGVTDGEFAEARLTVIERLPIRILGAILNAVPTNGFYRYYSYCPSYATAAETDPEPDGRALVRPTAIRTPRTRG